MTVTYKTFLTLALSLLISFTASAADTSTSTSTAGNGESAVVKVESSSGAKLNESANKAQSQNKSSQTLSKVIGVVNMGVGAMYASQCGPHHATACALAALHFIMGAQSFSQAKSNGGAAYDAGLTGMDTSSTNPFGDPGAEIDHLDSKVDSTKDEGLSKIADTKKLNQIKTALSSGNGLKGFKFDSKSGILTTPNGKSYSADSLTDKDSLSKAGFSGQDVGSALEANAKFEAEALKKLGLKKDDVVGIGAATAENGFSDGGAGPKYSSASSAESSRNSLAAIRNRNPASSGSKVAGLTKNFNGERIGVAAENIFNMMTRRYKTKEKQDAFFDPSQMIPIPQ
ncbi:MAG: hypothetical protein L6Q37_02330 [Bdellovibrionaceae bacterium]|nr:hypothetical protein [Pseudobdellovibrionaceae bacterium]NUM58112.1 hypothetical protein [Pseudobdellovibrionaceae bacterium]